MKPQRVLGKGLSALIPDADGSGRLGDKEVRMLPLTAILSNPDQPRKIFDDNSLHGLAESIGQVGVLQPVLVRRLKVTEGEDGISPAMLRGPGASYRLVAGERRVRAAKLAGVQEIPAIVCTYEETEALRIALLENIQREDLGPLEEAAAYRRLLEAYGATQEELAAMLGKNRSSVTNLLRLLTLENEIQAMLATGELTRGHAKALLGLPAGPERVRLARLCRSRGLSVRECERRVQGAGAGRKSRRHRRRAAAEDPAVRALQERAERVLGAPVQIERDARSGHGVLSIRFFSDAELERLLEAMGIDPDLS
jgi:ParB family chromosome partitioning protein